MSRPSLDRARALYVHRYTMQHVPAWALKARKDGSYYAPQFRTDAEWYANTTFPGEPGHLGDGQNCYTTGQTWPLGQSLPSPLTPWARAQAHKVAESEWRAQA